VKFKKGDLVGRTFRAPGCGIVMIADIEASIILWLSGPWQGKRCVERNKELSKLKVESV
jgi:transposase